MIMSLNQWLYGLFMRQLPHDSICSQKGRSQPFDRIQTLLRFIFPMERCSAPSERIVTAEISQI